VNRYEVQDSGDGFRITDTKTDSRISTSYLRENAQLVVDALNGHAAAAELAEARAEIERLQAQLAFHARNADRAAQAESQLADAMTVLEAFEHSLHGSFGYYLNPAAISAWKRLREGR